MEDKDTEIIEQYITSGFRITLPENVLLSLEKLLKAYKQDEKIINEMAKNLMVKEIGTDNCGYDEKYSCDKSKKSYRNISCINCIIDYFRKECE